MLYKGLGQNRQSFGHDFVLTECNECQILESTTSQRVGKRNDVTEGEIITSMNSFAVQKRPASNRFRQILETRVTHSRKAQTQTIELSPAGRLQALRQVRNTLVAKIPVTGEDELLQGRQHIPSNK